MSSHLLRSVSTLLSHGFIWRSSTHRFLGLCLGGREERNSSVDCWPPTLHTLSASSSSFTQGPGELNKERFALSKTGRKPSLGSLDTLRAGIPALESTKHRSKAVDVAVWSHHATRDYGNGDTTVPWRMLFRRGWATQSLQGAGDKPLRNKSTWETLWNLLKTLLLPIYSIWKVFRCKKQLGNILK